MFVIQISYGMSVCEWNQKIKREKKRKKKEKKRNAYKLTSECCILIHLVFFFIHFIFFSFCSCLFRMSRVSYVLCCLTYVWNGMVYISHSQVLSFILLLFPYVFSGNLEILGVLRNLVFCGEGSCFSCQVSDGGLGW